MLNSDLRGEPINPFSSQLKELKTHSYYSEDHAIFNSIIEILNQAGNRIANLERQISDLKNSKINE